MQNENKKGFQVRDLIVTALLSVCALVIYILCAFLSFSPYTMLVVSPLGHYWQLLHTSLWQLRRKNRGHYSFFVQ